MAHSRRPPIEVTPPPFPRRLHPSVPSLDIFIVMCFVTGRKIPEKFKKDALYNVLSSCTDDNARRTCYNEK